MMKEHPPHAKPSEVRQSPGKSFLYALPMMLLTLMMLSGGKIPADPQRLFVFAVTYLFFNLLFFLMIHTGKTDRYRATAFITYAILFIVSFISHMFEARGSMSLSQEKIILCEVPFCHLVIPMTLIPAAFTKTIIFPGSITGGFASIASMFVIWIGASLSMGRGWCSWGCFFGGLDDAFSRILKKPLLRKIDPRWNYLPWAVLLAVVLTAAAFLSPTYCEWLCPFKTVTEFQAVTSFKILVQTIIFVSLFIALVIVLPLLTKRRIQCSLFCPFGAMQGLTNRINAFDVRIDPDSCINCKRCMTACPTFSVTEESIRTGRPLMSCMKCGTCVDVCPKGAASFHVRGTPVAVNRNIKRLLFLYAAFLFLAIFSGGTIQDGLSRIIRLITTGSMI
ncbi:MAG: 4Fe-4S binding protein [Proteobacteria bacterium]|nr:4Fe-4S binding protein [Pseudomonadota bacterium]